jgi:hypothetical protein
MSKVLDKNLENSLNKILSRFNSNTDFAIMFIEGNINMMFNLMVRLIDKFEIVIIKRKYYVKSDEFNDKSVDEIKKICNDLISDVDLLLHKIYSLKNILNSKEIYIKELDDISFILTKYYRCEGVKLN